MPEPSKNLAPRVSPDGYLLALPPGNKLSPEEARKLDLEVGFRPQAVEVAYEHQPKTYGDLLMHALCVAACAGILWAFFPWKHFFVAVPEAGKAELELDLITEGQAQDRGDELSEEERTRVELTRLMAAGQHDAVKELCRIRLEQVPADQWGAWQKVWDFYLKALHKTHDTATLRDKSQQLLEANPDHLSARYYIASTLIEFGKKREYSEREAQRCRRETERAIRYAEDAVDRLETAIEVREATGDEAGALLDKRDRYRILLAEAHMRCWWVGGYQSGDVEDVNQHRDKALVILEQIGEWAPAFRMRLEILRDTRRDWWFEGLGKVFLKGRHRPKDELVSEMNRLEKSLRELSKQKDAEKHGRR